MKVKPGFLCSPQRIWRHVVESYEFASPLRVSLSIFPFEIHEMRDEEKEGCDHFCRLLHSLGALCYAAKYWEMKPIPVLIFIFLASPLVNNSREVCRSG
jgi:hypothetical protein